MWAAPTDVAVVACRARRARRFHRSQQGAILRDSGVSWCYGEVKGDARMKEIVLSVFSVIASLIFVIIFIAIG